MHAACCEASRRRLAPCGRGGRDDLLRGDSCPRFLMVLFCRLRVLGRRCASMGGPGRRQRRWLLTSPAPCIWCFAVFVSGVRRPLPGAGLRNLWTRPRRRAWLASRVDAGMFAIAVGRASNGDAETFAIAVGRASNVDAKMAVIGIGRASMLMPRRLPSRLVEHQTLMPGWPSWPPLILMPKTGHPILVPEPGRLLATWGRSCSQVTRRVSHRWRRQGIACCAFLTSTGTIGADHVDG